MSRVKSKIKNLLETTTIHALPNMVRTEYKCLRTIFFVISTSTAVYFTCKNILDYLEFDVTTRYDVINEEQSEFPTVSFCNSNNFNQNLENIITECKFNANTECFLQQFLYFKTFKDDVYGTCLRFSGEKSNGKGKLISNGNQYGLELNLNIKQNDELVISIHNNTRIPTSLFNCETYVSPGSKSEFAISNIYTKFTRNLPQPYNECLKNVTEFPMNRTFINLIINNNKTYSQKECLQLFLSSYYLENIVRVS